MYPFGVFYLDILMCIVNGRSHLVPFLSIKGREWEEYYKWCVIIQLILILIYALNTDRRAVVI